MTETPKSLFTGPVVVTGGSSGIGAALVQYLLARDVAVGILDMTPAEADVPAVAPFVHADVSSESEVQAGLSQLHQELGSIGHLACVAGIGPRRAPSTELAVQDWRRMLAVHVDGTFFACRSFKQLGPPDGASIVTIGSVAARAGLPQRAAYVTAKGAIAALTRSLAVEWACDGVRVNCVHPGYVFTPMVRNAYENGLIRDDPAMHAAQRRLGEPHEIASVIAFLLSTEASFITGEDIVADGGFLVQKLN